MKNTRFVSLCIALSVLLASPAAFAFVDTNKCVIDISSLTSAGAENSGDPLNSVVRVNLGPNALVTRMGTSGNLTTYGQSWSNEAWVLFAGNAPETYYYQFTPDVVKGTYPFSRPLSNLDTGVTTGAAGILMLNFFESSANGSSPDTRYGDGSSITVNYSGGNSTCTVTVVQQPTTTCASEGYKGAQLTWCKNICENGLTGQVLDSWIHRWINRYRDLPYCAVETPSNPT